MVKVSEWSAGEVEAEIVDVQASLDHVGESLTVAQRALVDQLLRTVGVYGEDRSGWPMSSEMAVRGCESVVSALRVREVNLSNYLEELTDPDR